MAHGLAELTLHGSQLKFPCCEHLFFLNDFTLLQLVHTIFCRLFFVLLGSKLRALRLHGVLHGGLALAEEAQIRRVHNRAKC